MSSRQQDGDKPSFPVEASEAVHNGDFGRKGQDSKPNRREKGRPRGAVSDPPLLDSRSGRDHFAYVQGVM